MLRGVSMRPKIVVAAMLLSSIAFAKDLKAYQDGKLLGMDSVSCAVDSRNEKKTHDPLCQQYTLETDQAVYSIHPLDAKHPVLLPLGTEAKFRFEKVTLLLRVPSFDSKERKFSVAAVKPRGENSADATPARVNHLQ